VAEIRADCNEGRIRYTQLQCEELNREHEVGTQAYWDEIEAAPALELSDAEASQIKADQELLREEEAEYEPGDAPGEWWAGPSDEYPDVLAWADAHPDIVNAPLPARPGPGGFDYAAEAEPTAEQRHLAEELSVERGELIWPDQAARAQERVSQQHVADTTATPEAEGWGHMPKEQRLEYLGDRAAEMAKGEVAQHFTAQRMLADGVPASDMREAMRTALFYRDNDVTAEADPGFMAASVAEDPAGTWVNGVRAFDPTSSGPVKQRPRTPAQVRGHSDVLRHHMARLAVSNLRTSEWGVSRHPHDLAGRVGGCRKRAWSSLLLSPRAGRRGR